MIHKVSIKYYALKAITPCALVCALLFFQGCASTQRKEEKIDNSQLFLGHADNLKENELPNSVPVLRLTKADLELWLDSKWSKTSTERINDSNFDERIRQRVLMTISIAGTGLLQCSDATYSLLRVEVESDMSEVWLVDLCGEKKVFIDSSGEVLKVGNVTLTKFVK